MIVIFSVAIIATILLVFLILGMQKFLNSPYKEYFDHRGKTDNMNPPNCCTRYGEMPRITFKEFRDWFTKDVNNWFYSENSRNYDILLTPYYLDRNNLTHYFYFKTFRDFRKYYKYCLKNKKRIINESFQTIRDVNMRIFQKEWERINEQ